MEEKTEPLEAAKKLVDTYNADELTQIIIYIQNLSK